MMRRREFITLLGGAAVAWPLAGRAQERMKRIGALLSWSQNDPEALVIVGAFSQGLSILEW
jgi:putative tryptophan/tyrosine transport system substrate-binding protein